MQLRRWSILSTYHSQKMIHSSNFEMSHGKRGLSDLIAHSDSSTAERAAILIFLPPWLAIPCLWALPVGYLVLQNGERPPSLLRFTLSPVPLWFGFCACAWGVMFFVTATLTSPFATRPRVTPPLTISLPRFDYFDLEN